MTEPYDVLFADAMDAINIMFDRRRRSLRQDYERQLAAIAADEQEAIAEAKQNVKAARLKHQQLL